MKDGKRRSISCKTKLKGEARKRATFILGKIIEGTFDFEKKEKPVRLEDMLHKHLEWCQTNHRSYESDKAYAANLLKHFSPDLHIQKMTAWDIERYKKKRLEKVKPATVNHDIKFLKQMFKKANEWGDTCHNPTGTVKKLREDNERLRFLVGDERERLLAACDHESAPWYLGPIVRVAINTGMRRGEILGLRWSDVNVEKAVLRVAKSKSGKPREIPMNQILVNLFRSMERTGDRVFPVDSIKKSWTAALKRAGITDLRFHDLRHEFASQLVMDGENLKCVQELLGHSSLRVTQRYAHLDEDHKRKAVERLVKLQQRPEGEAEQKVVPMRKMD